MKIADAIVSNLRIFIENKSMLEVACGDSNFSLSASKYADNILATDLNLNKTYKNKFDDIPKNIRFIDDMDASNLLLEDESFDTAVCYNALNHLENVLETAFKELLRVIKKDGYVIFVSTWSIDKSALNELLPLIKKHGEMEIYEICHNTNYSMLILKKISYMNLTEDKVS